MDNETYVLGLYENDIWSFFNGEEWVCKVQEANKLDRLCAFELCEKFAKENLQVVVFKSSIFEFKDCPADFSFEGQ